MIFGSFFPLKNRDATKYRRERVFRPKLFEFEREAFEKTEKLQVVYQTKTTALFL